MMNQGLEKMKDVFVKLSRELDDSADVSALQEAHANLPVEWPLAVLDIMRAADVTSYNRYQEWYDVCTKGPKRSRDTDYNPSEDAGGSSESPDSKARGKRPKI
ncbi:hypothetical protein P692DRAFT_20823808 [Suillus brevipes Sb2]|nr:hypothetical protein P692DRAFT_20823808 [Suillus brevipes Sb2]